MIRKKLSKEYELTSKLTGSFLRYFDTLSDMPIVKYVVLGLGIFLVFLERLYYA